ncbi:CoA-disulfide reductase [Priestia flexa]|uniref:CoA-disulfide reductase n=1 Tax=Priestia flexa TaxID=86664 RepID=UPI0020A1A4B8|nr:CoA-disulfide reductase [Priestia flexa]MCP1188676.1 CoA-disulfide reductase [Priestia flexa]
MKRIIVIGGVAGGMSAASQLRRLDQEAEIIVFEKGRDVSYSACGMPYYLSGVVKEQESLIARTVDEFKERDITVHLQHEVKEVNHIKKYVVVHNHQTNESQEVSYDELIIAAGASAVKPPFMIDAQNVFSLKTLEDSTNIHRYLKEENVQKVVIIGGGYIGMELVETMHLLGKQVSVIERGNHILSMFDEEIATRIQGELKNDIAFHVNEEVEELIAERKKITAVRTNKNTHEADLVIVNVGVKPNTSFLERNGIRMLENGAILINDKMETNVPHLYAAGDCASSYHLVLKKPVHFSLGTIANKQGRILGANLGGEDKHFPGVIGTSILKVMDLEIAKTGITEKEAKAENLQYKAVTVDAYNHTPYYPDATKMLVKLIYEKDTHIILGAQIMGKSEAAKRIDVFATAITARLTTEQLTMLDLSYAPPFATVWDAVQIASQKAT